MDDDQLYQRELAAAHRGDYLRLFDLPPTLLGRADHAAFHLRVARLDGRCAAAALAFDHRGDFAPGAA